MNSAPTKLPSHLRPQPPADPAPYRTILAAIGSICVVGLATGLTLPLVSVRLLQADASAVAIAALAALPAVGTIGISFALSTLTRTFGAKALMVGAMLLSCASILVLATPYSLPSWVLSRLGMGVATGILFALGEARILEITGERARGRWTGLYATMLTACQFAGPALLAVVGTVSSVSLVIAAALHGVSIALLARTGWSSPVRGNEPLLSLPEFIRHSLPLAAAVLFFAMFDSTMLSLLPVYGLKIGFLTGVALLMVTVVFLGDACLQIPIGWAADRFGRPVVHSGCALLTGLVALTLPGLVGAAAMWPCLFLLGGAAGGVYTLAIVRIGDRFGGGRLISANAFVGLLWGAGSLSGPLLGGLAMAALKPHGLMLLVAAGALACLVLMSYRTGPISRRS
jgi:MFS family permease